MAMYGVPSRCVHLLMKRQMIQAKLNNQIQIAVNTPITSHNYRHEWDVVEELSSIVDKVSYELSESLLEHMMISENAIRNTRIATREYDC